MTFLADNIAIGSNTIYLDSDADSAKLAYGILRYELLVWMRNGCTENHFDLDSEKNKKKKKKKKKKAK